MTDIFYDDDIRALFSQKRILFFGDSNMRALYKDLVWLMKRKTLMVEKCLETRVEKSFEGDNLIVGALCPSSLKIGKNYQEVREYKGSSTYIKFTYVTKCINDDMKNMMSRIKQNEEPAPNLIIMNSCDWDITRWGPTGAELYRENLKKLMELWKECLPPTCLVVWTTAVPFSLEVGQGSFLVAQVDFIKKAMPPSMMQANLFAKELVASYGYDVVDFNLHLRLQIIGCSQDGIPTIELHNTLPLTVRHLSNMMLTHICRSWGKSLPGRRHTQSPVHTMNLPRMPLPGANRDTEQKGTKGVKRAGKATKKMEVKADACAATKTSSLPSTMVSGSSSSSESTTEFWLMMEEKTADSNPSVGQTHGREVVSSTQKRVYKAGVVTCDKCGGLFKSKAKMRRHAVTQCYKSLPKSREDLKPYACPWCEYRSSVKESLTRHIRAHTGDKPYACSVCNYTSTQSGHLKLHMRSHTGDKPYACSACNYRSSQGGHLKRHLQTHKWGKPHACS